MLHFVLGYLRDLVIGTGFPLAERRPCYSTLPTKIQNGYGMAHLSNLLWEATELVHSVMPPNSAEAIDLRTCEHHPSWASVLNGPRSIFNVIQQSPSPTICGKYTASSASRTCLQRPLSSQPVPAPATVHFRPPSYGQPESPTPGPGLEWNLPPKPNSTHHLIFNSVSGLLQRWSNTLHKNGATCYNISTLISCKAAF
jgi:hypothetical protein